jgi:hypothetical protein
MKSYEEQYLEFMHSLFNRQKKPIVISLWKISFFTLLIINGAFFSYIGLGAAFSGRSLGLGVIGLFIYGLPLILLILLRSYSMLLNESLMAY